MSTLEQLELEEFGFQLKPAIQLFEPESPDQLDSHYYNLLALSNNHGLLFVYLGGKLKVLDTQELDKLLSDDPQSDTYTIESLQELEVSGVVQLILSGDESYLFIVKQKTIQQIAVTDLRQGKLNVQDLTPLDKDLVLLSPNQSSSQFAYLLESGELVYFDGSKKNALKDHCSCFCWIDNNTLLVGQESSIEIIGVQASQPQAHFAFDDQKVVFVSQLEPNNWLVVLAGETDEDDTTSFVVTKNGDSFDKKEAYDICMPFGVLDRKLSYYSIHLHNWSETYPHLTILTGSKSTDFNTLTSTQQILQLNDSDRAQMPLDPDSGDDDTPLGLVVDLTGKLDVVEPCKQVEKCASLPRMITLTNRGQLLVWNVWVSTDINAGKVSLEKARESIKFESEKTDPVQKDESPAAPLFQSKSSAFSLPSQTGSAQASKSASPFGESSNSKSSPFGQSGFKFGQTAFGTPSFGQSSDSSKSQVSNPFGGSQAAFGSSGFGAFAQSGSAFKIAGTDKAQSSGFGAFAQQGSAFKSAGSNNNESTKGIFGNSTEQKSIFGQSESKSIFGQNAGNKSVFGQPAKETSLFGGNSGTESPFASKASSSSQDSPFGGQFKSSLGMDSLKLGSKPETQSPFANLSDKSSPFANLTKKSESPVPKQETSSPFATHQRLTSSEGSDAGDSEESISEEEQESDLEDGEGIDSQLDAEQEINQSTSSELGNSEESFEKIEKPGSEESEVKGSETERLNDLFGSSKIEDQSETKELESSVAAPDTSEESPETVRDTVQPAEPTNTVEENDTEEPVEEDDADLTSSSGHTIETPAPSKNATEKPAEETDPTKQTETKSAPFSFTPLSPKPPVETSSDKGVESFTSTPKPELTVEPEKKLSSVPMVDKAVTVETTIKDANVTFGESSNEEEEPEPLNVPQLISLDSVVYPELSSNECMKEMERIVYDTEAEFSILDMNIKQLEEFLADHSNDKYPHEFSESSMFPESWRLGEVGSLEGVLSPIEEEYKLLKNELGAVQNDTISLLQTVNKVTKQADEVHSMLRDTEKSRTNVSFERQATHPSMQKLAKLRKEYEKVRDLESDLHSKLFVLNGKIYPEEVLTNPSAFEVVVSGIDSKLRAYYDGSKQLRKQLDELHDKTRATSALEKDFDKLRVTSVVLSTAAKQSLASQLQERKSVTQRVEL